jgi:lysine-N-methylase
MLLVPDFYKKFKCIADKCTDSCCVGWEIEVDEKTLAKYKACPDCTRILQSVELNADTPYIRLDGEGRCPHLDGRGLCKIISAPAIKKSSVLPEGLNLSHFFESS